MYVWYRIGLKSFSQRRKFTRLICRFRELTGAFYIHLIIYGFFRARVQEKWWNWPQQQLRTFFFFVLNVCCFSELNKTSGCCGKVYFSNSWKIKAQWLPTLHNKPTAIVHFEVWHMDLFFLFQTKKLQCMICKSAPKWICLSSFRFVFLSNSLPFEWGENIHA